MKYCLVRPPHNSGYNLVDVREESIITYFLGYLKKLGCTIPKVFDFHLNPDTEFKDLVDLNSDVYVIAVRETGATYHYSLRLARALISEKKRVVLYGQTGRLKYFSDIPKGVEILPHDETLLADLLGVAGEVGQKFGNDLVLEPYYQSMSLNSFQKGRMKASIETTRGCHFQCKFCFINHGVNYPERWQVRPSSSILKDVQRYYRSGVRTFVFHDSELIGVEKRSNDRVRELFSSISESYSDISIRVYARADTLKKFDDLELLRKAGVTNIFIGVESLSDGDLRSLRKSVNSETIIEVINKVKASGISMNLSFMLFNRGTTVLSLRENVSALRQISKSERSFLGVPKFLFSFESIWDDETPTYNLTNKSYIKWMVLKRAQKNASTNSSFSNEFEAIAEICRLVFYEIACKITEINQIRQSLDYMNNVMVDNWFDALWPFSISVLEDSLNDHETGELTIDNLESTSAKVMARIDRLYCLLPDSLRTWSVREHWSNIISGGEINLEDHGWDDKIPNEFELFN